MNEPISTKDRLPTALDANKHERVYAFCVEEDDWLAVAWSFVRLPRYSHWKPQDPPPCSPDDEAFERAWNDVTLDFHTNGETDKASGRKLFNAGKAHGLKEEK